MKHIMPATTAIDGSARSMGKMILLGPVLYISPDWLMTLGGGWFPELRESPGLMDRARHVRRDFWNTVAKIIAIAAVLLLVLYTMGYQPADTIWNSWWRVGITAIALLAAPEFLRHTSRISSGGTIIDRIDRGGRTFMMIIAIAFLLAVLLL